LDSKIVVVNSVGNGTDRGLGCEITIYDPTSATFAKQVEHQSVLRTAAGACARVSGAGDVINASAVNAIRLLLSSGDFAAGTAALYGFRKT
jgi:hypothetical protein